MPDPTISVIIPTFGRPTLARAVESARAAGADEIVIVADGEIPGIDAVTPGNAYRVGNQVWTKLPVRTSDYGASPRNRGMELATGTWLSFLDDDDTFLPGRLTEIKPLMVPGKLNLCRMTASTEGGDTIWKKPEWPQHVGTPCILIERLAPDLPRWVPGGLHDSYFVGACVDRYGPPNFIDRVLCLVRPI